MWHASLVPTHNAAFFGTTATRALFVVGGGVVLLFILFVCCCLLLFLAVAATMRLAYGAGISTFVTGGIGGVHRDVVVEQQQHATWDVSADLTELARTPVIVVSAGIKSILDIRRTLEVLET
jgi:Indigoidine synthase A like protein